MSTDFNTNASTSKGGFKPSTVDTPLDIRTRVETEADIMNIPKPYIGMVVYVIDTGKRYEIISLKDIKSGLSTIKNGAVGEYREMVSSNEIEGKINEILMAPSEDNGEMWDNLKELMEQPTIADGIQRILEGKQQEKVLGITPDDIGKILSVAQDEDGEMMVKAIDNISSKIPVGLELTDDALVMNDENGEMSSISLMTDEDVDNILNDLDI